MSSASKKFFFFVLFLLQTSPASELFAEFWFKTLGRLGNSAKKRTSAKMLTPNASSSKLLGKNMLEFVGNFLEPDSAQKMIKTSKQWSNVKIYENIFPNEYKMAVFRNVNTGKITWETIKFKEVWKTVPNQKKLVSHLRRNDSAKWNDVFVWFVENQYKLINDLICKKKSQNAPFLTELMLAIAENASVSFTDPRYRYYPLMVAAAFEDTDSILTLIKRGADVHQQSYYGRTALHYTARYGNLNACATLLENNANIDAADRNGWTPLMKAAINGKKNLFEFLIEKGAKEYLTNNDGKTALQLVRFQKR